ncbi:MAG TPA: patatin-like phospholipase family protein [Candidatus Dormibacteraeota bacterium]|nr:patatin-like phospholipase family protein [Candidatus Dormibacteraeota bacterium]
MINRPSPRRRKGEGTPAVAFVLSGGASLGAVQVGMLRALLEQGVVPDLLVGTSVGAVNAGWVAARPEVDAVDELTEIWLRLRRGDVFPISPLVSAAGLLGRSNHFIPNDNLRAVLEKHLPFERIEDTPVPLHVVTTDLKSGRAAILTSGPAVPALLASCAIPGVFPPVTIGRRNYVDGGVANHTPITVAIELGATEVYVLPVGYPWLNREPTNALGMALHALARIVEQKLDAEVAAHREVADIHVMPVLDIADVSPADFSHSQELIDWGYRAARRTLGAAAGANGHAPNGALPARSRKAIRLGPQAA